MQKQELQTIILSPQEEIKALILRLKLLKSKKDVACADLIQELLEVQSKLDEKQQPYISEANEIEEEIKELSKIIQTSVKTEHGQVTFRKGAIRISYDRKALDEIQNEEIRKAIDPYKKITESEPSIKVEIY